jgi:hypothetical protein
MLEVTFVWLKKLISSRHLSSKLLILAKSMKSKTVRTPISRDLVKASQAKGTRIKAKGKNEGFTSPSTSLAEARQTIPHYLKEDEESLPYTAKPTSHFSNLTLENILLELIQNCQRSQASKTSITTFKVNEVTWLTLVNSRLEVYRNRRSTVTENSESKQELHYLDRLEDMGICHLANRGVIVESGGRLVILAPEHFSGKKGFEIQPSRVKRGTKISFPIAKNELSELSQFMAEK